MKHLASFLTRATLSDCMPVVVENLGMIIFLFLKVFFIFCIARQVLIYALITKPWFTNSLGFSDGFYESLRCQNKSNELNIYLCSTPLSVTGINNHAVISLYSSGGETWLFLPCNIWKWVEADHTWCMVRCSLQGKLALRTTVISRTQLCLGTSALCCSVHWRQIQNNLPVSFIESKIRARSRTQAALAPSYY